jgi:hypothetical protein
MISLAPSIKTKLFSTHFSFFIYFQYIVSNPPVKQLVTFNQFITMMPSHKISGIFL